MGWARKYHHQQLEARATCLTCGWETESRNAHGSGVQHARKNSHHVDIFVANHYSYGPVPYTVEDDSPAPAANLSA